jgi:hypothetical protein
MWSPEVREVCKKLRALEINFIITPLYAAFFLDAMPLVMRPFSYQA